MSGTAVIAYLLENDSGVTAVVPAARVFAGPAPENTLVPYIEAIKISGTERHTVSMAEPQRLRQERVQVTLVAANRAARSQLLELVRLACHNRNATVNGISVLSILPMGEGPDDDDLAAEIYAQPIDFFVRWRSA